MSKTKTSSNTESKNNKNNPLNASGENVFPTSSSIPFPYSSGPYPQQAALMDALLQSLHSIERDRNQHKNDGDGTAATRRRDCARVIMLESPTGTGKSLSLACAAIAWLRYRQEQDFRSFEDAEKDDDDGITSVSEMTNWNEAGRSKVENKNALDWLDAWVPPSSHLAAQIRQEKRKCAEVARGAREVLEIELQGIRKRLDILCSDDIRNFDVTKNKEVQNDADPGSKNRRRVVRENLARSAVIAAIGIERRRNRRMRVAAASDVDADFAKGQKHKRRRGLLDLDKEKKENDLDFCVEEYKSDGELGIHDDENDFDSDDSYINDNHRDNKQEHHEDAKMITKSSKVHKAKGQNSKYGPSPRDLLDGGKLDGSGIQRQHASALQKSGGIDNTNKQKKKAGFYSSKENGARINTTIGEVQSGTGVRKIIYAARTHSQLSQFVSEIRRTAWGKSTRGAAKNSVGSKEVINGTVRVVALGGRKILCGNEDVAGTLDRKRSEAWITEKCLDLQKGTSNTINSTPSFMDTNFGIKNESASKSKHTDQSHNGGVHDSPDGRILNEFGRTIKRKNDARQTQKGDKKVAGCPLLASKEALSALALHMLAQPSDIEDLAALGNASHACSYYASRESLAAAEVVVMPYNMLLSKHARQSVGLSLKQSLVIIDEAHNIPEALRSLSSCRLSLPVVEGATSQLSAYVEKYASRLAGRNLFYLGQIRRCLIAMTRYLKKGPRMEANGSGFSSNYGASKESGGGNRSSLMMSATELLFILKLDNLNLFKVIRYLEKSRLAQKLLGFTSLQQQHQGRKNIVNIENPMESVLQQDIENSDFVSKHISFMSIVQNFLMSLTGTQREGKIVVEWPIQHCNSSQDNVESTVRTKGRGITLNNHPGFRFVLLNPGSHFHELLEEAYAVVLAGGTLRPFSHMAAELFGGDPKMMEEAVNAEQKCCEVNFANETSFSAISSSLTAFTCSHVVPPAHVYTVCLSSGPTRTKFDFRHSHRKSEAICDELGRSLLNFCNVVPAGFVVFFPSFSYEAHVVRRWKFVGIYEEIQRRKKIYREPSSARDVERTLEAYSKSTISDGGAILSCVIGGKMSEGINFANGMARCVFIVGLPYADVTDPELQEKMRLMDREFKDKKAFGGSGITGQAYYHNLCMRSVNQSIGRAIRHVNDYAAIVLADVRYVSDKRVWRGLPHWLQGGRRHANQTSFGQSLYGMKTFFKTRG